MSHSLDFCFASQVKCKLAKLSDGTKGKQEMQQLVEAAEAAQQIVKLIADDKYPMACATARSCKPPLPPCHSKDK